MRTSIYGIHPGVVMVQRAIAGLPARTGRSLDEWVAVIKKDGPAEVMRWLKQAHAMDA
jgi:hypothetical protein